MDDKTIYLTEEGLTKLKNELNYLKTTKRKEIAGRIASAKELGDLSENAEYSAAKEDQSLMESRVLELEEQLRHVEIIVKPKTTSIVLIGSSIVVESDKKEFTFEIVGSNEANPSSGKISNESPLGKSFLGKKVGDEVEVTVPKGKVTYTVKKIA